MASIKYQPDNRPLFLLEQGLELMNYSSGTWIVVFINRIKGPLTEKIVRQALDMTQWRHPRLNCRIVGPLDNLRFECEGTGNIPLRVVNNRHWQDIVLEELNRKIDNNQVLMRAALLQSDRENLISYLITTIHHAIIDGLSGIQLQQEILTNCQNVASGKHPIQRPRLSALPPVEELLPERMRGFKSRIRTRFYLPLSLLTTLWHRPQSLDFEKYLPVALRRCGMVHRQLDEALTHQLLKTCKNKKTTIQAALCAAMLFSTTRKIPVGNKRGVCVSCITTLDLRRRLTPPISEEHLGILASTIISHPAN